MSDTTYYVLRSGHIINAMATTKRPDEALIMARRIFGDDVTIDAAPPIEVLRRYEFWDTRP